MKIMLLCRCAHINNIWKNSALLRIRAQLNFQASSNTISGDEKKKHKILVTTPEIPKHVLDFMARECELIVCQSVPSKLSEIIEKATGVHGFLWRCKEPLHAEVLDAAGPQLRSISAMSVGIDHIDVAEVKRRKISLSNTPGVPNDAVADIAVGLLLAAARRFYEARLMVEEKIWENYRLDWMLGQDLYNSVVGFFGFGSIAQAIAKRLMGFDIGSVLYNTRRRAAEDIEKKFSARNVDFDTLLAQSDFVIIAAPLTTETDGIFNAAAFSKMKKNAVLVNIARGGLVNHQDLYIALKTKQIFAAGLDATKPEPLPCDDPLLTLPNLVILPHIGATTQRARNDMAMLAAENLLLGLAGKALLTPVN